MTKFKEGDKVSWENPEPIFCKGDEVHHWREGKGTVGDPINHKIYMVQFCHRNKPVHESELSFTPYNLKDGGFSQVRGIDFTEPIPMKAGDARVLLNGYPVKVDFRIISEENYQILLNKYLK